MATTYGRASWPIPALTDAPNATTMIQAVATQLDQFVVPKYASAAAQTAANPSPADGDNWYRTDLTQGFQFRNFSGGAATLPDADSFGYVAEQTLGVAVASVTFTGIPQTWKHLKLIISAGCSDAVNEEDLNIQINGNATTNYASRWIQLGPNNTTVSGSAPGLSTKGVIGPCNGTGSSGPFGNIEVTFPNYTAVTPVGRTWLWQGAVVAGSTLWQTEQGGGTLNVTGAMSSFTLTTVNSTNFVVGSFFGLYGMGS